MSSESFKFNRVAHYGDPLLIEQLEHNLKHFLDWAFLKIGAWQEIDRPADQFSSDLSSAFSQSVGSSGVNGGSFYALLPAYDRQFNDRQVFGGIRKEWVYETGVNYLSPTSVVHNPSSVEIFADGVATGDYYVNYPLGQVVFDTPVPTGTTISAKFPFRRVQTYLPSNDPWGYEINFDSMDPAQVQWTQSIESGIYAENALERVQLPAVSIEMGPQGSAEGYQLGSTALRTNQDILFHVAAQNSSEKNNIVDILRNMKGSSFTMYDLDQAATANRLPLDYRGDVNPSGYMLPDLAANFPWEKVYFSDVNISQVKTNNPHLHMATVRVTLETII